MKLIEQTFAAPQKVDRESMVVRGVKILGRESKNGRTYSDRAMESLERLYDGIAVNVDHDRNSPGGERKMAEGVGILRGVRKQADGIYGDFHYLANHRDIPLILERAERMPESFGLSHVASGRVVRKNGKLIVEDVEEVRSVDIVREPATTQGLFESSNHGEYDMAIMTLREIVEAVGSDNPNAALLIEQMDAGLVAADETAEVAPEASSDDQIKAAFRAAVVAAFDDDSLDTTATLGKIRDILKAQEKLMDKPAEEPAEEEPAEEAETEEETATESIEHKLLVAEAKNLLLESGREATPERVRAVAAASEKDRKLLVESWPAKATRERPATSKPKYAEENGTPDFPRDPKKFAASLR